MQDVKQEGFDGWYNPLLREETVQEEDWLEDLDPYHSELHMMPPPNPVPRADEPAPVVGRNHGVKKNISTLRAKVFAMHAFQGFVNTINQASEEGATQFVHQFEEGTLGNGDSYVPPVPQAPHPPDPQRRTPVSGAEIFQRASDLLLQNQRRVAQSLDIDQILKAREDAGEAVLAPSACMETEWSVPDLTLIFRPPKSLMDAMAHGISPGKWIKIAPDNRGSESLKSRWGVLKSLVATTGAFKTELKDTQEMAEREHQMRKDQIKIEVEQLKSFLLSITTAWEQLMAEVQMDSDHLTVPPPTPVNSLPASRESSVYPSPAVLQPVAVKATARPKPSRGPFICKAIATGICHLFDGHTESDRGIIDIDVLATYCQFPWPPNSTVCSIMEVCGGTTLNRNNSRPDSSDPN
mmetsp:Transcript_31608/g.49516  ORF Transcript_31608/g.49516 Transcript_31608/m.49516 type:complete len:408 (+) Transcript_31608:76-1299(+)